MLMPYSSGWHFLHLLFTREIFQKTYTGLLGSGRLRSCPPGGTWGLKRKGSHLTSKSYLQNLLFKNNGKRKLNLSYFISTLSFCFLFFFFLLFSPRFTGRLIFPSQTDLLDCRFSHHKQTEDGVFKTGVNKSNKCSIFCFN